MRHMKETILNTLEAIEKDRDVTILHAIESGSRAWGFASPNSDYDVRFIYMHPKEHYLRLDKRRDVIELPINSDLDINGWDFNKTLRLLHSSNPTLFEWLSSPIVYKTTNFIKARQLLFYSYFNPYTALQHYLSMAKTNYRTYLKTDRVPLKKYFYVMRPLLCCRWILDNKTQPPVEFTKLIANELDKSLEPEITMLLNLKTTAPEQKTIERICVLNDYIESEIEIINQAAAETPKNTLRNWAPLNTVFREALNS